MPLTTGSSGNTVPSAREFVKQGRRRRTITSRFQWRFVHCRARRVHHPIRIERRGHVALPVERGYPALAVLRDQLFHHYFGVRIVERHVQVLHPLADVRVDRQQGADERDLLTISSTACDKRAVGTATR